MPASGSTVVRVLVIAAGVVALALILLWLGQRRLIYLPDSAPAAAAGDVLAGAEDVTLITDDGLHLGGYYVPARGDGSGFTVLVANGNGGNREGRIPLAEALADAGFSVLLFDYRGYGGNPGSPTEDGLARDARAAYRHLVHDRGESRERLLYYGESLGTGVVTELATTHPPAGLFLRSPFPDLAAVASHHYPLVPAGLLLRDRYPVADHLGALSIPTTVLYGTADSVIPPELSRQAAAAGGQVEVVEVPGADHNDAVLFDGPRLIAAMHKLAHRASRG